MNKIYLCEVKYYEKGRSGIEYSKEENGDPTFYTLVEKDGDQYHSVFYDYSVPIFERVKDTHNYAYDEYGCYSYGTKIRSLNDIDETGMSFLIKEELPIKDIDKETLKKFIFHSSYFFIERQPLLRDALLEGKANFFKKYFYLKKYRDNRKKQQEFEDWLSERRNCKKLIKE